MEGQAAGLPERLPGRRPAPGVPLQQAGRGQAGRRESVPKSGHEN